jgi:hypothetical protein
MRKMLCGAAVLVLVALVLPSVASAQYREFSGKIDRINDKKLIVDNRMGDKVTFMRVDETAVSGEKTEWKKLSKDDWVTVSWKMIDKPRKAYKIVVNPPRDEEGEDVD